MTNFEIGEWLGGAAIHCGFSDVKARPRGTETLAKRATPY